MPPNSQGPLPNFLIIGAQRSATRWLRSNLSEHPEILIPPWDVSYFSTGRLVRQGGERFYREQFESWDGEPFVGESSPNYMMWGSEPAVVARRIRDLVPDVRLIALVRQPVDRMYSALLYQIKRGRLPADADLFGMVERGDPDVDKLDLVRAGLYAASLHPFRKLFGEQLLILVHDDVTDAPEKAYESALRHIGASTDFVPDALDRVVFSTRTSVRHTGPRLTDEQRRILYGYFRFDVEELEVMTGIDLTAWDPGPPVGST